MPYRMIVEMAVNGSVDTQDKVRKVDMHASHTNVPNKPTTTLLIMSPYAIEWVPEGRNMGGMSQTRIQNLMAIETYDDSASSKSWRKIIVSYPDPKIGDPFVRYESIFSQGHVISSTYVRDN